MQAYGDNFIPIIPVDYIIHKEAEPFCYDPTCPCHEDREKIEAVAQQIQDGLIAPGEATEFVKGKTL